MQEKASKQLKQRKIRPQRILPLVTETDLKYEAGLEASNGSRLKERKAIYSTMQPVVIVKACSKGKTTVTLTTCFTSDFTLEN